MKTKKRSRLFYIKWLWLLLGSSLGLVCLLFLFTSWGFFGKLPTFEELENPEKNVASEVISMDGVTLGKFAYENRTPINFDDLSEQLVKALIATEDERFYSHSGIDFKATLRAFLYFGKRGGGSTITQQLAKLILHGERTDNKFEVVIEKVKEYIIAARLEKQYTKQEIIAMYLNKYDFLNQAVGIRSASRIYFGKEPNDLNLNESAILIGMLKNSSLFNPLRESRKIRVIARKNVVLNQMLKNNFITKAKKDSLRLIGLELNVKREGHNEGNATYFRENVRAFMSGWIKEHPKPDGTLYNLHRDGLKIHVSIDSRMQRYAEEATREHMQNLQSIFFKSQKRNPNAPFYNLTKKEAQSNIRSAMKRSNRWRRMKTQGFSEKEIMDSFDQKNEMKIFTWTGAKDTLMTPRDSIIHHKHYLRSGLLAVEPSTGFIKAWVGGIDYKYFQYDAVKQQKRQVGSTFKPYVYATAIDQLRLSPCTEYPNTRYVIAKSKYGLNKDWAPNNSSGKYGGDVTIKYALANSLNVISARLIDMVHPRNVVAMAKNLGVQAEIPELPSIALGSVDLSLYEMVGSYATFGNKGLYTKPIAVLRIEDKYGNELERFVSSSKEVLSKESSYAIVNLLEGVTRSGSGVRLRSAGRSYPDDIITGYPYQFENPIAGKTGTTQNQSDGWFIGMVPNLVTGVWVGGEDRATHFPDLGRGQGGAMALPIWALFYDKMYKDLTLSVSKEPFEKPKNYSLEVTCGGKSGGVMIGDPKF